jgi:hypothetical protein
MDVESAKLFWKLKPLEPELSFSCRLQYFLLTNYSQLRSGKLPSNLLQRLRWLT